MQKALIIGASGGIGSAVQKALDNRGVRVTALSRRVDGIDLRDEESVAMAVGRLTGPFDLILVATGALEIDGAEPEKTLKALTPKALADQFALNATGPALVLKHALPLLPRNRRAIFAALSARVGSISDNGLGGWYSYRASKAALNQLIHSAAIELKRTHRHLACVCLHPGTVATAFTKKYQSRHPTVKPDEAAQNLLRVIDGLSAEQTGRFYDWAGKEIPW